MKNDKHMNGHEEDLKKIAPDLFKIKKDNAFQVPEGYFEKLPLKIQSMLPEKKGYFLTEIKKIIFRPQFAFAAMFILLLAVFGVNYLNQEKSISGDTQITLTQEKASQEEILTDITKGLNSEDIKTEHIEEIDESLIIEQINDQLQEEEVLQDLASTSDDEINYLLDNNIDVSLITEELKRN